MRDPRWRTPPPASSTRAAASSAKSLAVRMTHRWFLEVRDDDVVVGASSVGNVTFLVDLSSASRSSVSFYLKLCWTERRSIDHACERARDRILGLADDARVKRRARIIVRERVERRSHEVYPGLLDFCDSHEREKTEERTRFDGADSVVGRPSNTVAHNSRHFITRRRAASFPSLSLL